MASEQDEIAAAPAEQGAAHSIIESFNITGFSVICAWHFLVLFSSVSDMGLNASSGRPLPFQLTLYFSLAVSYLVMSLLSRPLNARLLSGGPASWRHLNIAAAVFATLATAFMVLARGAGFAVETCSWVLLGLSEAALMVPWLQLVDISRGGRSLYRNLIFNMGLGACIAFVVGNLFSPYGSIVFCALPLASAVSPVKTGGAPLEENTEQKAERVPLSRRIGDNASFICCGIVFGLSQAVFSAAAGNPGTVTYDAGSSWPIVGALLSTIIAGLWHPQKSRLSITSSIQRFSSLVFIAGIMVSFYFITSESELDPSSYQVGDIIGQTLTLAGYNSFDFGFMILAFSGASLLEDDLVKFIGANRFSIYLSMGVGLLAGSLLEPVLASFLPNHVSAITALLVILLAASTLFPFNRGRAKELNGAPVEDAPAPNGPEAPSTEEDEEEQRELERQQRISEIEELCHLSNRERQVFSMLADGKNANEIQQELWISIHTVKTHISNVYHKLEIHSARELVGLVESDSSFEQLRQKKTSQG